MAAIELIHKQPVNWVKERTVKCDGGGGPLGHPRIFINVDKPQICWCTYCGLPYVSFYSSLSPPKPGRFPTTFYRPRSPTARCSSPSLRPLTPSSPPVTKQRFLRATRATLASPSNSDECDIQLITPFPLKPLFLYFRCSVYKTSTMHEIRSNSNLALSEHVLFRFESCCENEGFRHA